MHRPRRWNAREGVWMGHERKRGKLADLNALLRGPSGVGPARLLVIVGDTRALPACATSSRSTPTRSCPAMRRRQMVGRWRTRSTGPRFGRGATLRGGGRGLRHPAAARGREPDQRDRSGYARLFGGEAGHRPLHARRLRCLPGSVRRGLLHRQGHLRRRRVRARAARPLPREPHPEPRPDRRLLRALRPAQRRAAVSRTRPRATASTWRAATAGFAATGSLPGWLRDACTLPARHAIRCPRWRAGRSRQPAPQPDADCAAAAAAAGLVAAARTRHVDPAGAGHPGLVPLAALAAWRCCVRRCTDGARTAAPRPVPPIGTRSVAATAALAGLPALRGWPTA